MCFRIDSSYLCLGETGFQIKTTFWCSQDHFCWKSFSTYFIINNLYYVLLPLLLVCSIDQIPQSLYRLGTHSNIIWRGLLTFWQSDLFGIPLTLIFSLPLLPVQESCVCPVSCSAPASLSFAIPTPSHLEHLYMTFPQGFSLPCTLVAPGFFPPTQVLHGGLFWVPLRNP